ncbi:MAG: hypothetical protein HGA19_23460, partial [Oscillochloris sp.]|nr:hypothetical protein [Oscillochloris sp.]
RHNLRGQYITRLWDVTTGSFRDNPRLTSFVANKAATVCEALFLLSDLRGEPFWVEHYALPTLEAILTHQVSESGPLEGAIAQNSFNGRPVEKYMPFFIARCISALIQGYEYTGAERYFDGACRAMDFIERWVGDDGAPPMMVFGNEQTLMTPRLVAPLGDILRAGDLLKPYGVHVDLGNMRQRLLDGQDASGGIQLATGFACAARRQPLPELRDIMHVTGWCDKAFRYLAAHAGSDLPAVDSEPVQCICTFHGRRVELQENAEELEVYYRGRLRYRWCKGRSWAEVAEKEFWAR